MKKIFKVIIFISILVFIWLVVFDVLHVARHFINMFYKEPKSSLDVVYIGNSNVSVHFNTTLAFEQYGYATGLISSGNQPSFLIKNMLIEAQKYQKPKVFVIDINCFGEDFNVYTEEIIRNSVDNLKLSLNRIDAINRSLKYVNISKNDPNSQSGNNPLNYYFRFLMYHNSWKNITKSSFDPDVLYKTFWLEYVTTTILPLKDYHWPDERNEIPKDQKEILIDLLKYIKENKLNVLFVIPCKDYTIKEGYAEQINTVSDIIRDKGYEVMNFNTIDDFKVDYSHDFYNRSHLNIYGSTKYTLYFGKYLKEKFDLPDHRDDLKYVSWNDTYLRLIKDIYTYTNKNFNDIVNEYIPLYQKGVENAEDS